MLNSRPSNRTSIYGCSSCSRFERHLLATVAAAERETHFLRMAAVYPEHPNKLMSVSARA